MSETDWLSVATEAAHAAGEVLRRHLREGTRIWGKETHNLVTDADLEAERAIAAVIQRRCPGHAILGEEEQAAEITAEDLWIVDPLDGTNNFAHGVPHYSVSVAYYRQGVPIVGVVFDPERDQLFAAARGHGASCNGRPIHVGTQTRLDEVLVGVGFYYDRGKMMEATLEAVRHLFYARIHGIRRFGSAALDLCAVASGQYGAFFEYLLSPWDFAAGRLIVEEAGGMVTTTKKTPLPLEKTSLLASNGSLHEAACEIISRFDPTH